MVVVPGQETQHHIVRVGYFAFAPGVLEAAAEADEGGQPESGSDDAPDDGGRFGGVVGSPVVGDGFGDAAEFDDGEFGERICA